MKFVVIMKFGRVGATGGCGLTGWHVGRSARLGPHLRPEGFPFGGTPTPSSFVITTNFMITKD